MCVYTNSGGGIYMSVYMCMREYEYIDVCILRFTILYTSYTLCTIEITETISTCVYLPMGNVITHTKTIVIAIIPIRTNFILKWESN